MNKLRHPIGGLLIFIMLVTVSITIYDGMKEGYGFTETGYYQCSPAESECDQGDINIMQRFEKILIVQGVQTMIAAIEQIATPTSQFDLVGGLLAAGFGVSKILGGVFIFPMQIISVVGTHFGIDGTVTKILGLIFTLYIYFIILSAILGREI